MKERNYDFIPLDQLAGIHLAAAKPGISGVDNEGLSMTPTHTVQSYILETKGMEVILPESPKAVRPELSLDISLIFQACLLRTPSSFLVGEQPQGGLIISCNTLAAMAQVS